MINWYHNFIYYQAKLICSHMNHILCKNCLPPLIYFKVVNTVKKHFLSIKTSIDVNPMKAAAVLGGLRHKLFTTLAKNVQ